MDHKIRIKLGAFEIEYEGAEDYLKNELPALIDKLVAINIPLIEKAETVPETVTLPKTVPKMNSTLQMSTNTIAAKLGIKSGPDLVIAACVHLNLVKRKETFHRKEILAEMQAATNYYKNTHNKNLTHSLKSLVTGDKLIERTKDTYALSADQKKSIKSELSGN